MAYKEPGVYLEVKNNPRGVLPIETLMFPLIIGSGAKKLKKTITMVRGSGQTDTFPFTSVASISHIGSSQFGASEWLPTTDPEDPQDYTFVANGSTITWETDKGPVAGSTYYVTLVHAVETTQYEPKLCSSIDEVVTNYGPDIQENESGTPVCPVSLGAQIALSQGAPAIYVLQVACAGAAPTDVEYSTALNTYAKFLPDVWRIIPMDQTAAIQAVVTAHINLMSTVEERMERCGFYGKEYTDEVPAPTGFDGVGGVLTVIGGFATGLTNKRLTVIYPDVASKTLSDGVTRDLAAPYILAAIAGAAAAQPTQRSYTRMNFTGFNELKGVKMTRTQKNKLAEKGIMIIEQAAIGSPISIRHQLSTDMASTQSRENSILAIQDYCAKYLRSVCEGYIGRYNIDPQLITMVKGTINSAFTALGLRGVINKGKIDMIQQDADNPDTIVASVSILPPYPCNYIEIVLILE